MNNKQQKIAKACAWAMALMLLFPPTVSGVVSSGFNFIFNLGGSYSRMDVPQLMTQWLGVILIGGILFYLAKEPK